MFLVSYFKPFALLAMLSKLTLTISSRQMTTQTLHLNLCSQLHIHNSNSFPASSAQESQRYFVFNLSPRIPLSLFFVNDANIHTGRKPKCQLKLHPFLPSTSINCQSLLHYPSINLITSTTLFLLCFSFLGFLF